MGILFTWIITNKLSHQAHLRSEKTEKPATLSVPKNTKKAQKTSGSADASGTLPQLLLNGIVLSEDGSIAMINGQICKPGDEVEGAKIVDITASQVTLSLKNQEIVLKNR